MDTTTENNLSSFSDLWKDVYNSRPRHLYTWFRGLSHEEQGRQIEIVAQMVRESIAAQKAAEAFNDSPSNRYDFS